MRHLGLIGQIPQAHRALGTKQFNYSYLPQGILVFKCSEECTRACSPERLLLDNEGKISEAVFFSLNKALGT